MAQATSPYLRQHKDNPVHWQPWGAGAFDAARALNRPVLLSVGYAACHWCHVMAHESFDNPAIATLINARFVAIKLDREERPDLDALYQQALALMGKPGGWPLTLFLTADGVPFWGGTYFPPLARHGLPGFADVLRGIAESYANESDAVRFNADSIRTALLDRATPQPAPTITPETIARASAHILGENDPGHGGLGSAPKFPQLTKLRLLFDHGLRSADTLYTDAVLHALVQMCRGGLYDHLGGGFHRYCVDAQWLVPHFEKMGDDQAQFIALLSDVLSRHPHPLLHSALEDTVAFVLRDMTDPATGLFISSLDADSDDGEGGFYQWRAKDIIAALGAHAPLFFSAYDVRDAGNWDDPHRGAGNILNRLSTPAPQSPADEALLRTMRKKLLRLRQERTPPARDDKILADVNARMIAALASAGWRHSQPAWVTAAKHAFTQLTLRCVGPDTGVHHLAGDANSIMLLDDVAQLGLTALTLAESAAPEERLTYLGWARRLARAAIAGFLRPDGTPLAVPLSAIDSFSSLPPLYDTPAPAAAGALLRLISALAVIDAQKDLQVAADTLAHILSGAARTDFAMMASTLSALQFYQNPIVVHAHVRWLAHLRPYLPDTLLLPADHAGLTVCIGTRCLLPADSDTDAQARLHEALRAALHKPANG